MEMRRRDFSPINNRSIAGSSSELFESPVKNHRITLQLEIISIFFSCNIIFMYCINSKHTKSNIS